MPPGTDLSYSWSQAANDLGQVAPIVALTGFFLLAVITDLVLPRARRGGVVAMFAVVGFAYSLGTAAYRWINGFGGPASRVFAAVPSNTSGTRMPPSLKRAAAGRVV